MLLEKQLTGYDENLYKGIYATERENGYVNYVHVVFINMIINIYINISSSKQNKNTEQISASFKIYSGYIYIYLHNS